MLRLYNAPNTWSPITEDPSAPALPGGPTGTWLIDTGARWSLLSESSLPQVRTEATPLPPHLRLDEYEEAKASWTLEWCGRRTESLLLGPSLHPYAKSVGIAHVDGVLGMDLLAQWVLIFDVSAYRAMLFDHGP